jgi:hypothetical protein
MPPRCTTHSATAAELGTTALAPLPLPLVLHIFSLLPVDCRLRCCEVCRGWRSVLLERSLWTRLDLTAASGVRVPGCRRDSMDALLRCAAARAGGGLQCLRVDKTHVSHLEVHAVAAANAGALRELHAHAADYGRRGFKLHEVEALLRSAPLLRIFATDLTCARADVQTLRPALRNEAPFAPLHVRQLYANLDNEDAAGVVAFAADVAGHASLTGLSLEDARLGTPAALDAVVDAALARRMQSVMLEFCDLAPASAPALARLLSSDALTQLACTNAGLLDAPAAGTLAAALRANATLTSLTLERTVAFNDAAAWASLLGALTGHASLRKLSLPSNRMGAAVQAAAGASLGALVAANAPALTKLNVSFCDLGDDGLRPLFQSLPANTHLRELDCSRNFMSEACARDVLLPAVRANESLRVLLFHVAEDVPSAHAAERIVSSRRAA